MWPGAAVVGARVGFSEGGRVSPAAPGAGLGATVGSVGARLGACEGSSEGAAVVGTRVGFPVGARDGTVRQLP